MSPLASAVLLTVILICHARKVNRYLVLLPVIPLSMLLLSIGTTFDIPITLPAVIADFFNATLHGVSYPSSALLSRYLISDPASVGLSLVGTAIASTLFMKSPQQAMLERHAKKARKWVKGIAQWIGDRGTLIFGVSGSGKTALINRISKAILDLDDDSMQIWVDGKGSVEKYSLHDVLTRIHKAAGKELIVINGTANPRLGNIVYNFLDAANTPDQAADMIMCLISNPTAQATDASEHYRTMTKAYLITVIDYMMKHSVPVTLYNVITLMDPTNMEDKLSEDTETSLSDHNELIEGMKSSWDDVTDSHAKLKMFIQGQGKAIFTKADDPEKESVSITEAYRKGANVLILADAMSMPSLAQALVSVASMDIRNLIAGRLTNKINMNRRVYVTYDEFTSYTDALPIIQDMYSRARSADVVMTLATQSISDIKGSGNSAYEKIINTGDRFFVFQQHGGESPEAAAKLFGTYTDVSQTARTSGHFSTGESSNTLEQKFKVSPNEIRDLEPNTGFFMDTRDGRIIKFQNEFV